MKNLIEEEKIDARHLSQEVLEEKRKIIVKLRNSGMKNKEVAKIVDLSPQTTSICYTKHNKYGLIALKSKKRSWY